MNESTSRRAPPMSARRRANSAPARSTVEHDPAALQVDRLRKRFSLSVALAKALAPIVFGEAQK